MNNPFELSEIFRHLTTIRTRHPPQTERLQFMMAAFLAIPLKKTPEIDLVKPFKAIISSCYSSADDPVDCSEALNEVNKLRMNSTWRTLDKHESSLEVMYRYYDQLTALETKCPPTDSQITFKWRDAFDKGSFFGGYSSLSIPSIGFEKSCILFNIAAMQSQIAASQANELGNDDSLKSAAKNFQQASGIFQHLKNNVMSSLQQEPTPDLHPDTLGALQSLMLAQAQESYFHKACADKMKDLIIARVASQCEDLYADALKQMQKEQPRLLWEKDWLTSIASKQAAFQAICQFHQAAVCKIAKDVGEELCRLQCASDMIKASEQRAGYNFAFKDYASRINRAFEEAKKDNDFIYHARIPDIKNVTPIDKAALAKPIPLPEKLSPNSPDLFSALLPISVQQAVHTYDVRRTDLVNTEIGKLRDATQIMNGILASMNLPAALEDTMGCLLPQSLEEKANSIRSLGGIDVVQKLVYELPSLLQRNKEILDEADRMLIEEEQSDTQLRAQFKERWNRTSSDKLNGPLKATSAKYRQIINNAIEADKVVQEKFRTHKDKIDLLSRPIGDLQEAIPSGSPQSAASNSSCFQELQQCMLQVDAIKNEREVIESELKCGTTDMKSKFLSALSSDGSINEQALSVETLGEIYGPLQKQARDNIARQEALLGAIQAANGEFCKEKSCNQNAAARETMLSELAAAHDAFQELYANLQEGTKFYNDLTELLLTYQNKLSDFSFARKTEKDELHRELQQNIANSASQPTPTPPAHHTGSAPTIRPAAPARPPPPSSAPNPYQPAQAPPPTGPPTYNPYQTPPGPTPQAANVGQPNPNLPYPPQFQQYPQYPVAPLPAGYNPYGQPPMQQYQPQQYNPYMQYPPAPPTYYNYPQQQWR